ncbi:hypothetical protein SteCoe_11343 [Stentor coeruleus]|uniref:RING-type domain-containing protein n=1 Tax=Stentor coeruleus TaxID=5963 RepID=A0A1R2CDH0_9CILI|nr:hypothetical protein SteCoe_11343 [Stentor coeruleus]
MGDIGSQELKYLIGAIENLFVPGKSQELSREILDSFSALSASASRSFDKNGDFAKISKLLNCTICHTKKDCFKLNCFHYICKNCFKVKIQPHLIETLKQNNFFECPECQRLHSLEDSKIIFGKNWIDMEKKIKSERIRLGNDFICSKCKNQKSSAYKVEGICPGHKYCSECIGIMGRTRTWCKDITQEGYEISENIKGLCTSCEKTVYYNGDFLTFLCRDHLHCYYCLQKAEETGKCQTCCMRINNIDRDKIDRTLYSRCSKCNSHFEKIFFIPKKCCNAEICALCQMGSELKCVNCMQMLEKGAVELVQSFEAESSRRADVSEER